MNILMLTDRMIMTDIGDDARRAVAEAAGPNAVVTVALDRDQALAAAPSAEVVLGCIDEALFAAAPRLKWVQATSSGVDFMMYPALRHGDVILTCEKGLVGAHLADHAMALLLALTRQLAAALRDGHGAWDKRLDYRVRAIELEGLVMGIIGYGGTGRAVARRAAGFQMTIRAVDRDAVAGDDLVPDVEPLDRLDAMLAGSDVVAVCAPLTAETTAMIDAGRFAAMKPGAVLLNVTRGELVDHPALVAALESGRLGGAGLDVHHIEPLPADDPLWRFDNVVMSPHTAGASQLRAGRNMGRFIENLGRYRRGEPLVGLVDKKLGY
jgi:phosphoglycerate dehydrogenase-like enzyme